MEKEGTEWGGIPIGMNLIFYFVRSRSIYIYIYTSYSIGNQQAKYSDGFIIAVFYTITEGFSLIAHGWRVE